jgi:exosortase D (VPLPA-CTERM-specific)
MTTAETHSPGVWRISPSILILVLAVILGVLFADGIVAMVDRWDTEEYSHAWLIPFVAVFLAWIRFGDLPAPSTRGTWLGFSMGVIGLLMLLLGEFSAVFLIVWYGLLMVIWGIALALLGWPIVRAVWPALLYLAFMVPLPWFLLVPLSADLQLISSKLGVGLVRLAGVPVFLDGNVIDLGEFRLQVAEACSGLRYLFPLMSFGFLCAFLYQGRWWDRALLFLSTIPITILMNSFRIGVIGLLVSRWGPEQAEGFLHFFEGWVVFMLCVAILFLELMVFSALRRRRLLKSLMLDGPPVAQVRARFAAWSVTPAGWAVAVAVLLSGVLATVFGRSEELMPERNTFATFPLVIGDWRGQEERMDPIYVEAMQVDDYLLARFVTQNEPAAVGLWIAYYESQRKGQSVHSPKTCLPGGGWQIVDLREVAVAGAQADGSPMPVNRALIAKGEDRQLVYYWFVQRGRVMTNEYLVKWHILKDAMTINRTEGAMVRLTTIITEEGDAGIAAAERRLQDFVRTVDPKLAYFLPRENAVTRTTRISG